jgi:hypothetical protein
MSLILTFWQSELGCELGFVGGEVSHGNDLPLLFAEL